MARERLLDNADFMEIVRICIISRCTYTEAMKIIIQAGFKISSKTYQRAKIEIEQTRKQRISQIVDDLAEFASNTVDTATAVDYELWRIVKTTKNNLEKLRALEMIMKNCGGKSSNFDASPVLDKISKRIANEKINELGSIVIAPASGITYDVKTTGNEKHGVEENTKLDSR